MVAREPIPVLGRFDVYTRIDELLTHNVAALEELLAFIKGPAPVEEKLSLETLQKVPYRKQTYSLNTARTDEEINFRGVGLLASTDGLLTGCLVRLSNPTNPTIAFNDINPIPFPFSKIYLTTPAQAGKTLTLYFGEDVVPWASALPTTIQASLAFNLLRTDKDTEFTGALAQNAKEDENITGLLANKIRITGITLQSIQRLHYKLILWLTDAFDDPNLDLDMFCGEIDIDLAAYGIRVGGLNQWYLDVRDLHVDYDDQDSSNELHISLFNADPTAKLASTPIAVSGAVADDGGATSDETAAANSAAANDMTLLPAVPAVNDAYYFGGAQTFDEVRVNIGTQGVGTWTIVWEYYNGSAWVALSGVTDGTAGFTAAVGNRDVTFTRPGNWATVAVAGLTNYWVRARVSAYTGVTTQPLGTQAWLSGRGDVVVVVAYEPRT